MGVQPYVCMKTGDFVAAPMSLFDWAMTGGAIGFIAAAVSYIV